jgi:hypothetical protein
MGSEMLLNKRLSPTFQYFRAPWYAPRASILRKSFIVLEHLTPLHRDPSPKGLCYVFQYHLTLRSLVCKSPTPSFFVGSASQSNHYQLKHSGHQGGIRIQKEMYHIPTKLSSHNVHSHQSICLKRTPSLQEFRTERG